MIRFIDISPLRESKKFGQLWGSGLFVNVSFHALQASLIWKVFQETGSSLSVGLVGICVGLPTAIFSIFGGSLTDMKPPKKVGLLGVSGQILSLVLFLFLYFKSDYIVFSIYLYLFLNSSFAAITAPTRRPYLRHLLKSSSIPAASSLYIFSMHSGQILGPAIGGFLVFLSFGDFLIYFLHLFCLLLYLASIFNLPNIGTNQGEKIFRTTIEGLRYSFNNPLIRFSLLVDFSVTAMALPIALIPEFVSDVLQGDSYVYGLLMAMISVGGVFATLLSGNINRINNIGKLFIVSSMLWCLSIIIFSQSSNVVLAFILLFFMGVFDVITLTTQQTIIQMVTKQGMLGRVGGLQLLVGMGGPQIGNARAGIMGKYMGFEGAAFIGAPFALFIIFSDIKGLKSTWLYNLQDADNDNN